MVLRYVVSGANPQWKELFLLPPFIGRDDAVAQTESARTNLNVRRSAPRAPIG